MAGNFEQIPDMMLLRAVSTGASGAIEELYARYGPAVYSFLMARLGDSALAEEVQQDVMLSAWRAAGQFRGESKVLTWLLSIARNKAINARRRRSLPQISLNDAYETPGTDTGPFERVIRNNESQIVRATLDQLPAQQREVLVLVFYHQLTENEVADVLGIPVGTVKSRLHRGKEMLRRVLEGHM
jgi:RNA polymerase sigma-70 factor (ECF subfamily)